MNKKFNYIPGLQKCMSALMKVEGFIMVLGSAVLVIAILIAVVCRYWLYIPTPWSDELARYIFLWVSFIGMGYVTQHGDHIDVRLVDTIIKSKAKNPEKTLRIIIRISQILTLAVLLISTVLYGKFMFARYPAISTSLRIPMRIPYLSTLVGLILMDIHETALLLLPTDDPLGVG